MSGLEARFPTATINRCICQYCSDGDHDSQCMDVKGLTSQ